MTSFMACHAKHGILYIDDGMHMISGLLKQYIMDVSLLLFHKFNISLKSTICNNNEQLAKAVDNKTIAFLLYQIL